MTVGPDGRLFVADPGARAIWVLTPEGKVDEKLERSSESYFTPLDVGVDGATVYGVSARLAFAFDNLFGLRTWRIIPHYHVGGQAMAMGPGRAIVVTVRDDRAVFSGIELHPNRDNLSSGILRYGSVPAAVGSLLGLRRVASGGTTALFLDTWPRIQRWSGAGAPQVQLRTDAANDVAPAPGEDVYIVEPKQVRRIGFDGQTRWVQAFDEVGVWLGSGAAGPNDALFAFDSGLGRLVVVAPNGTSQTALVDGLIVDVAPSSAGIVVADRADGSLRLLTAGGAEIRRWKARGEVTRVAAAKDGSAFFALTSDGWVWKYTPTGELRAAWDGLGEGTPVDLDVDATGRVLVADGSIGRVAVWAPDPAGTPPVPPDSGDRCDLAADKIAQPGRTKVGELVTITLTVAGVCPSESLPLDVILVLDRSGSMEGPKLLAAKSASVAFTNELDFSKVQLGLVAFSSGAQLLQSLTTDRTAVVRAVAGTEANGETDIAAGLTQAEGELSSRRARQNAAKAIVLMTDGRPSSTRGANEAMRQADAIRQAGVSIFAIGLGSDVDPVLLRSLAGADDQLFLAPNEADLPRIFTRVARRLTSATILRSATVTDVLPPTMEYVDGSARPPAQLVGRTLTWQLADVPSAGLKLTFQVRPLQAGYQPTNEHAEVSYDDQVGFRGQIRFPVPRVNVAGNRSLFLPIAFQTRCPEKRFDFVLAIDTSGSMLEPSGVPGETKLDAARRAAATFLDTLRLPGDQAAIVAFNSDAKLVHGFTDDLGALRYALTQLPQATGTRIDRGLEVAGAELADSRHRPANLPVVILLTDGRPTDGTGPGALTVAKALRARGVVIFTIGLGADADGGLLVQIAGNDERYSYAPDSTSLSQIYRTIALTVPCQ